MSETTTIEIGDLVRVIADTPHFIEKPDSEAIGRVMPNYPGGQPQFIQVHFFCAVNPIGDYEESFTFLPHEVELVNIAELSSEKPAQDAPDLATVQAQRIAELEDHNRQLNHLNAAQKSLIKTLQTINATFAPADEIAKKLNRIQELSDIGLLFDGHDECNEETHDENEKVLTFALDKIHKIVTGAIPYDD